MLDYFMVIIWHMCCWIAVLDIIKAEHHGRGSKCLPIFKHSWKDIPEIKRIKGRGLMSRLFPLRHYKI
jgi:hypothetical protein